MQRPGEKINHTLVLGGEPGIGKDTLLEPVKHAVGHWNWHEITPLQLIGRTTEFLKSIVLRVNEDGATWVMAVASTATGSMTTARTS